MALPRSMRYLAGATLGVLLFLMAQIFTSPAESQMQLPSKLPARPPTNRLSDFHPQLQVEVSGEPPKPLRRVQGSNYAPNNPDNARISATLLSLVRNEEVDGIVQSMFDLERTWNSKFNYPWTFFNDKPFSEEFKRKTRAATKAEVRYELIPPEHWAIPSWINMHVYNDSISRLVKQRVQFAEMHSYHQMCRWNSGMFSEHPALSDIQYYWRVEPNVHFFCDIDYDVFAWMQDHNKTYGFTINIYDNPESVTSLFPETQTFLEQHPEYLHPNSAHEWVIDDQRRPDINNRAHGFSTCHFWSNFEIGDLSFWRSKKYREFFNHLDRAGGFFYERWGDAPVHSIALGLFEDKKNIHWFRDIGYQHIPFFNCPNSPKCSGCVPGLFTDGEIWLNGEDCRPSWFHYVGKD